MRRKNNQISGQFSARLIEMLASPAYRVISRAGHQAISRIEIELGNHGGNDNGRLPVTFDDFEEYGIERHAIAPALKEAEALGFIEITERGRQGRANRRRPNFFRLTYRPLPTDRKGDGTHEWRRVGSLEEAKAIAKKARQKTESLVWENPVGSGETPLKQGKHRGETPPPQRGETPPLSISWVSDTEQPPREARPLRGAVASGAAATSPTLVERADILQAAIASRLGRDGWPILQQLDQEHVQHLMALQDRGELREDVLINLRRQHQKESAA